HAVLSSDQGARHVPRSPPPALRDAAWSAAARVHDPQRAPAHPPNGCSATAERHGCSPRRRRAIVGGRLVPRPHGPGEVPLMKKLARSYRLLIAGTAATALLALPAAAQIRPQTPVSTPGINVPAGGQWD